jgi:hypothetical protein
MLTAHSGTNQNSFKGLLALGAACLALAGTGCAGSVSGEHDTTFHFLVAPQSDGSFWGWTEITVGGDINSVGVANLWAVRLSVEMPPEADLSFLSTLKGEAVTPNARTTVVTSDASTFVPGTQSTSLNVVYLGDLHPLFKDSTTIRIEWSGATNPAFTTWPSGGIWMQGDVIINVQ